MVSAAAKAGTGRFSFDNFKTAFNIIFKVGKSLITFFNKVY